MGDVGTEAVRGLADALRSAGYDHAGVSERLGPVAHAALARNETTPGLRATQDGSPLATLTRLWPLQAAVDRVAADRALPGLVDPLTAVGLLEVDGDRVRAALDVRPYAEDERGWWVLSDLTPGLDGARPQLAPDHVLGVSSASTTLAQLTVRRPVARALDLGTGCGVQALHLSGHAREVVATDVNPRALRLARLTAALNDVALDLRTGSLLEPVAGEGFDLVVANPPFVVSPATEASERRLVYRDSGLPGDAMVRSLLGDLPRHLAPGGLAHVLANWVHRRGEDWRDRVGGWLDTSGCDAWVVEREVADPAAYVELWLKDAGQHGAPAYRERYDHWLGWFEDQGVAGIGFGWVTLRRLPDGSLRRPERVCEEWRWPVEQPLGPEVAARLDRVEALARLDDPRLLATRPVRRSDVRQETEGAPGAEDPETIVLRQQRGMRRARRADTVTAAVVGACDGDLALGQVLDALASLLGEDASALRRDRLAEVRELVVEGFLELPDG